MPTLQFKGRNIIWNHHLTVPYHTLDEVKELDVNPEKADGNILVEGDNLIALKALLPMYSGKIRCVFIDPPYNTGKDNGVWVYNDNVNSPLMKEWLGTVVDAEDMTRHDKWLCMMTPRLKLLRELLSEEGAIFITIDDYEQNSLKNIMDDIFGEENFVANIIWQHSVQGKGYEGKFSLHHNYVMCYRKSQDFDLLSLERTEEDNINYSNPDNDPNGDWRTGDIRNALYRPNLIYDIVTPSKKHIKPPPNGWRFSKETMQKKIDKKQVVFNTDETKVTYKIYLKDVIGRIPETIWFGKEVGTTREAKSVLKELFNGHSPFETPKPVPLIKKIINICCEDNNDYILDSFSGSGTTAHAALDLNKEDGGNRKFILVQMTEATEEEQKKNICKDITRERIKRAIDKYGYDAGFKYLRVGTPIDAETMLSGKLPTYKQFAKYVYYLCTGENLENEKGINEKESFVGLHGASAIHLIYTQNIDKLTKLALNLERAQELRKTFPKKRLIVYAPACFLSEEDLELLQIDFVGIPYNLFQRKAKRKFCVSEEIPNQSC
jgi:adenine-specific DNA-methyltransferase